jgi:hypothetical protein
LRSRIFFWSGELRSHIFSLIPSRAMATRGHTYGTQLSDDDKEKLLEYLKTL